MATKSEEIIKGFANVLKSNFFINYELYICSRDTEQNDAFRTLWGKCVEEAGPDSHRLRELHSSTHPVSRITYLTFKYLNGYREVLA